MTAHRKLSVVVEAFKPLRANTLYGFVAITIPELHLRVYDLTVHEKNGKRWIGLPAKPQVERSGCVDRETRDAFSARVIASEGAKWEPVVAAKRGGTAWTSEPSPRP